MTKLTCVLLSILMLGGCVVYEDVHRSPGLTPVQKADVMAMRASGYGDGQILDMIHANGVARRPSADDVIEMKNAGVSTSVMNAMLEAPITTYRPATEVRHRTYDMEPAFSFGAAVLTGYLIGRHYRH